MEEKGIKQTFSNYSQYNKDETQGKEDDIWDDSVLVNAYNQAVHQYMVIII